VLESLPKPKPLTAAAFGSALARFRSRFASLGTSGSAFEATHGRVLKFPRGTSGCFFPTVNGIAEHFGYCLSPANEMDLESVRLLLCAWLSVNPPDVLF
jgi:hypothetical protein